MQSSRWTTVQESEFPWEREALAHLRELLPDAEPFRAWSNFEFIGDDGSINEVDLLVVGLHRIYLVEIKSAPGRVQGYAGTWTWTQGGRRAAWTTPCSWPTARPKRPTWCRRAPPAATRRRLRDALYRSNEISPELQ
jgi:hypothetical protein